MVKLNKIRRYNTISFASKFKLYKSLVTSILLYGCETWTLPAYSKKRILDFNTKCLRKLLNGSYLEHKTNNRLRSKINFLVGPQETLLATVKRRKLAWFRSVTCHDSLSKTILHGTLEGGWCYSQQRKCWVDNIKEWTSLPMPELLTNASCRKDWEIISAELFLISPQRPYSSRHWAELIHTGLRFIVSPKGLFVGIESAHYFYSRETCQQSVRKT